MNFGKRATNQKRNALASRSTMMGKKAHVSVLRIIFISLIAILVIGGCLGIGVMKGLIDDAPDISDVKTLTYILESMGAKVVSYTRYLRRILT